MIGAGFGGIGTAIRLRQRGVEDFLVFERAADLGGTWRDNSYPGCACDVPSNLYSFSFAPRPDWSRSFSPQPEIWDYLRACADRYGLHPHLRLGHEVRAARWDGAAGRWQLDTSGGPYSAEILVAATGPLSEPAIPDLPGLDTFAGHTFHSARWDHGYDLTGRRVAVVGTGASAAQFVPEIAPRVAGLTVFQRTPPWVLPRRDRALTGVEQRLYRTVPAAQRLVRSSLYWSRELTAVAFLRPRFMAVGQRMAQRHLRRQVPDPGLRAKLTPRFTMGCKRVLLSNDYLPALARSNVDVVTEKIAEIRPHGIVTVDGAEHPADTLIFGTGFHVTDAPAAQYLYGRDGRNLDEVWQGSPKAYLGTTVAGFPNLFLLLGPNTGLGHTSVVLMLEYQIEFVMRALSYLDSVGARQVEPRPEVQREFVLEMDRRLAPTVWLSGGCASWYLDRTGRNSTIWPGFTWAYHRRLRRFDPGAYLIGNPDSVDIADHVK